MVTGQFIEKIVKVRWYDAWFELDESEPCDWESECIVETVGWVKRVTDKYVSVVAEVVDEDGCKATTHIFIPSIINITVLED